MSASDTPEPRTHPVTGQEIPPEPSGDVLVTRGDGDILTHWHGSSWRVHGKDQVYASWSEIFLRYPFVPEISVWHRIDDPRPVYPDRAVDARDPTMVRRALAMLPARCPYHDEVYDERQRGRFRTGLGACCETGEPALLRPLAEDAMSRICGDETPEPNAMLRRG